VDGNQPGGAGWLALSPVATMSMPPLSLAMRWWHSRGTRLPGRLIQLTGLEGCISETGTAGTCTDGNGLNGAIAVIVSSDGFMIMSLPISAMP
jgi:hypothetical protein